MRLTEQNVKELIIETSMKKAVFVYFYMDAPECEATTVALKKAISDDNEFIALAESSAFLIALFKRLTVISISPYLSSWSRKRFVIII